MAGGPQAARRLGAAIGFLAALALPGAAHAQCPGEGDGGGVFGFLGGILGAGDSTNTEFEYSQGGVVVSGSMEVKDVACGSTTVTIRQSVARQAEGEGNRGPVGGSFDARIGVANEIEVTLPNSAWNDFTPPNPLDPTSLPPGGSMILKQEAFASLGLEANYRAIVMAAGMEVGAGTVVAITRLPDGRIQLSVGPYEVVRNETMFGLGYGDFKIGLGRDDELEGGRLQQWTFDPNDSGDVRDYQLAFAQGVALGSVPFTGRPAETVEYATYESVAGIRAEAGPFGFGLNFGSSNGDVRITTRPDGTKTYDGVFRYRDSYLNVSQDFDANGNPVGDQRISVSFPNLSQWDAYMLDEATGGPVRDGKDWDGAYPGGMKLEITEENWTQWRDRAQQWVDNPGTGGAPPEVVEMIANAQSPWEVARALYTASSSSYTRTFQDINQLARFDGEGIGDEIQPLPGNAGPACPNATTADSDEAREQAETSASDAIARFCGSNLDRYASSTAFEAPSAGNAANTEEAVPAGMARD